MKLMNQLTKQMKSIKIRPRNLCIILGLLAFILIVSGLGTSNKEGFEFNNSDMFNVVDDQLVVEEKGIYSIEKFLISRRLMYWQVYMHKTVVSAEKLLQSILLRAKEKYNWENEEDKMLRVYSNLLGY